MKCANCLQPVDAAWVLCPSCGIVIDLPVDEQERTGLISFLLNPEVTEMSHIYMEPDPDSGLLYFIGPKDILPVTGQRDGFYRVLLPGGKYGWTELASGYVVELGINPVTPLGFYRRTSKPVFREVEKKGLLGKTVDFSEIPLFAYDRPDQDSKKVMEIAYSAVLPIVEESEGWFKVELPNRVRVWVQAEYAVRTIAMNSLEPTADAGDTLLKIAGTIGVLTIAAIGGISSAVVDGMQSNYRLGRVSDAVETGVRRALR